MNIDKGARRQHLYNLLGDLPNRSRKISVSKIAEENRESYVLEKLLLDVNGVEPVPACFIRPHKQDGKLPAVLYSHAHGGRHELGKDEMLIGRKEILEPPYAEVLTRRGYCALCIDAWSFGERQGRTQTEIFKEMLWKGQVLWGMMIYDNLRAIDYLVSRSDVDASRIADLGMSMGSTMSWWLSALDTRIKVCVDICCLTDFHALLDARGLDEHKDYYYVPSLLKHFTTAQINELIAPRAHLSVAGNFDKLTPPAGLDRVDAELKRAYESEGVPEAWKLVRYNTGHFETAAMRAEILTFLERWL